MGPEGSQPATSAELEALRLRVERLEQELAALRQGSVPAAQTPLPSAPPPVVAVTREAAMAQSAPAFASPPRQPVKPKVSLEKRLGSQVFNRIGIVALLIGTAWFLKLAIDNQWIGPVGRTLVGLIAGSGVILWSERFRRQGVRAFAYSLKAVGTGVLYLSLWAAFQLYHLLPAPVALVAMLLVTAWNAFMAWSQNSELLAAYALIGAFITPLLLSTGGNHEIFLFTYILAVDVATTVLIRLRSWPRLLFGTLPITILYFAGWYIGYYAADELGLTILFLVLFWLVFLAADLGRKSNDARPTLGTYLAGILLPLVNAAFLALGLYFILNNARDSAWMPWVTALLAAAYLGIMRLPQSRIASALHLSLAIVFLTVAIPMKATGHGITVAWLVEGAVLFWVAMRLSASETQPAPALRETTVLRGLSILSLALGLFATLAVDYWFDPARYAGFFNHDMATALVAIAACAVVALLTHRSRLPAPAIIGPLAVIDGLACLLALRELFLSHTLEQTAFLNADFGLALLGIAVLAATSYVALRLGRIGDSATWRPFAAVSIILINLIALVSGVREIGALWGETATDPSTGLKRALTVSAFLMGYSALLLAAGFWKRTAFIRWQGLILLVFTILKTFLYDMRNLSQGYRIASVLGLGALLMAVSFAYQKDWLNLRQQSSPKEPL